jgi:hypothetical protein
MSREQAIILEEIKRRTNELNAELTCQISIDDIYFFNNPQAAVRIGRFTAALRSIRLQVRGQQVVVSIGSPLSGRTVLKYELSSSTVIDDAAKGICQCAVETERQARRLSLNQHWINDE